MEAVKLDAKDGYELSLSVFKNASARGYIQVIHGMEEHKERYFPFAEKLQQMGYTVVVSDLRGHGMETACPGFFKEQDGYQYLLSDQMQITKYIRERFGVERVNIFAHSMGSIIARNLLQTQSQDYEKVALSGYPNCPNNGSIELGLFLTKLLTRIFGPKHYSNFMERASIGMFNRAIDNPNTPSDWICTDEEVVRKYIEDPYCGHAFTVSGVHDLFVLTRQMTQVEGFQNVNAALPILLLRGEEDPCTGYDKGAAESLETLRSAGFSDIRTITYEHMRHEILNERGKERVYADVIDFYKELSENRV
jgi:alpha-beta hydrolase superfamily lysophospholipase